MPRVVVTEAAVRGLERCREHLATRDGLAARRAAEAIERSFLRLETVPDIGRRDSEQPELRELVIAFGSSGTVALYRYDPGDDVVSVLAFRHQREAGY